MKDLQVQRCIDDPEALEYGNDQLPVFSNCDLVIADAESRQPEED